MKAIAVGLMLTVAVPAIAQQYDPKDPRTTLYSADMLRKALADITQMQEPEVRALIHYFAECTDGIDDVSKHFCASAQAAYEIEYGTEFHYKRSIDLMIYARSGLLAWQQAHPETRPVGAAQIADDSIKFGKMIAALEEGAGARLRALKGGKPK
jgi:hypothetical protein